MKHLIKTVFINRESLSQTNLPISFSFFPSDYHETECALVIPKKEKESSITEEDFDKAFASLKDDLRGTAKMRKIEAAKKKLFGN